MEDEHILKLLKSEATPKAPSHLKQAVLNTIHKKGIRKNSPSRIVLGALSEGWGFLLSAMLGFTLLSFPSKTVVFWGEEFSWHWNPDHVQLFVIIAAILFSFSIAPAFYPLKRKQLEPK